MLATAALSLSACRDREITAYRAPKDPAPLAPAAAATPMTPGATLPDGHPPIDGSGAPAASSPVMSGNVTTASGAELLWTAPAHWTAKDRGSMRKGSYSIAGDAGTVADLAVTAFPGDTGGLFANINRWRGQVGLPPIAESALDANVQHVDVANFHIDLVDITGSVGGVSTTLLGAIVPHNGQTWFFKLVGPEPLVAREKAAFREFLNTIKVR